MDIIKKWNRLSLPVKFGCAGGGVLFVAIGLAGGFDDPPASTTPSVSASSEPTIGTATSRPKEKTVEEKPVQYTTVRETSRRADLVLAEQREENGRAEERRGG